MRCSAHASVPEGPPTKVNLSEYDPEAATSLLTATFCESIQDTPFCETEDSTPPSKPSVNNVAAWVPTAQNSQTRDSPHANRRRRFEIVNVAPSTAETRHTINTSDLFSNLPAHPPPPCRQITTVLGGYKDWF